MLLGIQWRLKKRKFKLNAKATFRDYKEIKICGILGFSMGNTTDLKRECVTERRIVSIGD